MVADQHVCVPSAADKNSGGVSSSEGGRSAPHRVVVDVGECFEIVEGGVVNGNSNKVMRGVVLADAGNR